MLLHGNKTIHNTPEEVFPIRFTGLNIELENRAAVKTRGGSGPSGIYADSWRKNLTTKQFGNISIEVFTTITEVYKKLECCLIPLVKNPGL